MTRFPVNASRARSAATIAIIALLPLLGGCSAVVLSPAGDVAAQQRDLILIATFLMLLIIIPVMALTVLFARRYRAQNTEATYDPDWDHSTQLELVIWAAPLLIIICLGAVTWTGTHRLDPYQPVSRIAAGKAVDKAAEPLDIDVVALDWKWLFIYPDYGVATVNEVAAPVDRPVRFHITATSVMNSFYIPALAGQIYAMPSMVTELNAVINKPGDYEGFSANFSGDGFSKMRFRFHGVSESAFAQWIGAVRGSGGALDRRTYLALSQPSEDVPVTHYAAVAPGLFDAVVTHCVVPGPSCMRSMIRSDQEVRPETERPEAAPADKARIASAAPLRGAGLIAPDSQQAMTADADRRRGADNL